MGIVSKVIVAVGVVIAWLGAMFCSGIIMRNCVRNDFPEGLLLFGLIAGTVTVLLGIALQMLEEM